MTEAPEATEPDIFDDWLESGTVRQVEVEIQNDPAVVDEYEALQKRRDEVEKAPETIERAVGDPDPMAEFDAAEQALMERWEAGKSTWTLRALNVDETDAIIAANPLRDQPKRLPDNAPEAARKKRDAEIAAWLKEAEAVELSRRIDMIAKSLVSIKTPKGSKSSITPEQLHAMYKKPYGSGRISKLFNEGVVPATQGEVQMPRPKSRELSTSDPD